MSEDEDMEPGVGMSGDEADMEAGAGMSEEEGMDAERDDEEADLEAGAGVSDDDEADMMDVDGDLDLTLARSMLNRLLSVRASWFRPLVRSLLKPDEQETNVLVQALDPDTTRRTFLSSRLLHSKVVAESSLQGHRGCVNALDYTVDGETLASGSDDTRILFWQNHKQVGEVTPGHTENIFDVHFRGGHVVSCDRGGLVCQSSVTQCRLVNTYECNRDTNEIRRIAQDDAESFVCYCAADNAGVYRVDFREKHAVCVDGCSNCVAMIPNEEFLYSVEKRGFELFAAGSRCSFSVLDIRNPTVVRTVRLGDEQDARWVTGLCLSRKSEKKKRRKEKS
jgi:WD40 repeat protein